VGRLSRNATWSWKAKFALIDEKINISISRNTLGDGREGSPLSESAARAKVVIPLLRLEP
jgi:hypothetical protein